MQKIPMKLPYVRAARELREGRPPGVISDELGISKNNMQRIQSLYAEVSDAALASIERLLDERDQLRMIISTLMAQNDA